MPVITQVQKLLERMQSRRLSSSARTATAAAKMPGTNLTTATTPAAPTTHTSAHQPAVDRVVETATPSTAVTPFQKSDAVEKAHIENSAASPRPGYDIELNYRLDIREGGDEIIWGGTIGLMRRKYKTAVVRINDARGHEDEFNLDTHGFQWVKHHTSVTKFDDYMALKASPYYGEVAEMLKKVTGATRIHVIGHLHRSLNYNKYAEAEKDAPAMLMTQGQTPGRFVHIDQSYQGALRRLYLDLPAEEASRLEKTRWAIINVWRPARKVTNEPLAVCDAQSVREDELFDTMHLVPMRWPEWKPQENHMWAVAPPATKDQHRWHYLSGMTEEEVLLIKMFDSKCDGRARRVPHSSFQTPDDFGPPRESTETRCFVFWEDETAE